MCRTIMFSERSYVYCIGSSFFFHLFSQQVGHLATENNTQCDKKNSVLPSWSPQCAGEDNSDQVSKYGQNLKGLP